MTTEEVVKALEEKLESKGFASQNEVEAIKAELEKVNVSEDISSMKSVLDNLEGQINALKEAPKGEDKVGYKSLEEAIYAEFEANKEALNQLKVNASLGKASPLSITVKAPVVIGTGNTIGSAEPMYQLTQDTGIVSTIRKRELRYLANVSVGSITSGRALWTEETDEQGAPIFLGEGATKPQGSVLYINKTQDVKKVAVYAKMTLEMLEDLPQFVSFITRNLERRLDIVVENQLFNGNGLGDNLTGIDSYAQAFTGGGLAGNVDDANELDVIEAVALQVKEANGMPETLFVHPSTMAKIRLIKDTVGRPIWKDYVTPAGEFVYSGLRVIETLAVTEGNFVGGETSVVNVLNRSGLQIQIGLDGNDLTQNKQTMVLEKRLVQFVSANDTNVLIKGDFATAITAIQRI
jgi:HK97 family phage major capsid protein